MATGDMKARLLLDSKDFEKNIKKSRKSVDNFGKSGKNLGTTLVPQFKAIAAAALTVKAAEKGFKTLISSSQSLSDSFNATVSSMTGVVDNFVYSIANADFSPFNNGLSSMITKAREAYAAYDQLTNTMMSSSYVQAIEGANYNDALTIAKDKSKSFEERRAALTTARASGAEVREAAEVVAENSINALRKDIAARANINENLITEEILNKIFRVDSKKTFEQQRKELEEQYQAYLEKVDAVKDKYPTTLEKIFGAGTGKKGKNEKARLAAFAELDEQFAEIIIGYELLMRESDEKLAKKFETAKSSVAARRQASEIERTINETTVTLTNEEAAAAKAATKAAEKQAEVAREAKAAADEWRRLTTAQDVGSLAGISYADTSLKLPESIKMLDENPAQGAYDYWQGVKLGDIGAQSQQLEDMNNVVSMLGDSFARLGGSIGGSAGSMLEFVGSISDAAQAILPFISYLQAEVLLHSQEADAATRAAGAKAMSAYAGIPGAGIALGLGALAAVVAAVQSIPKVSDVPKFAEGGIVNRATLGIFGEAGPEAVMPLDKLDQYIQPRELHVTGNIKASGKDLMVVLDNYKRVRNG